VVGLELEFMLTLIKFTTEQQKIKSTKKKCEKKFVKFYVAIY